MYGPGSAVTVLGTGIGIVGGNAPPPAAGVPSGGSHGGSPPPRPVGRGITAETERPAGIRPVYSARSVRVVEQGLDKTLRGGGQHQSRLVNLPAPATASQADRLDGATSEETR